MAAPEVTKTLVEARAAFDALVSGVRPDLHRYCARMTGSVIDGEDVVQEALAKAYYGLPMVTEVTDLRGWLFRIAHNKAIDHLRRGQRQRVDTLDDDAGPVDAAHAESALEQKEAMALGLGVLLRVPPLQRAAVVLKDVMGYSLVECSEILDVSVLALKAALHRGRKGLREKPVANTRSSSRETDPEFERQLSQYVERFNARDFDALRALLAEDVRLDLVGRAQRRGRTEVGGYFENYDRASDWRMGTGTVEGIPAVIGYDITRPEPGPAYFVLVRFSEGTVREIRDYRYARYVMEGAEITSE